MENINTKVGEVKKQLLDEISRRLDDEVSVSALIGLSEAFALVSGTRAPVQRQQRIL